MTIMQTIRRWFTRGRRACHGPCSEQELHRTLQRERALANRNAHSFSVVIYTVESGRRPTADWEALAERLIVQTRDTDEVGWHGQDELAVVLPHTGAEGAVRFTRRLAPGVDGCFSWSVYTYGNDGDGGGGDGEDNGRRSSMDDRHGHADPGRVDGAVNGHATMSLTESRAATKGNGHGSNPMPECNSLVLPAVSNILSADALFAARLPAWKRGLDIVGASAGLVLTAPLFLAIVLLVRLTSPGPAIFRQRRSGLGGSPFTIYKFRTMVVDAERRKAEIAHLDQQDGAAFKVRNDPRVTGIGKVLRKTSLDELPQLWNVLKGDMSLVGPRPLPCAEAASCERWHRRRLDVTPGLTCTWQVRGRSSVTFDEWMRMDLNYIGQRTVTHDVKLLVQTVPAVVLRRGAC